MEQLLQVVTDAHDRIPFLLGVLCARLQRLFVRITLAAPDIDPPLEARLCPGAEMGRLSARWQSLPLYLPAPRDQLRTTERIGRHEMSKEGGRYGVFFCVTFASNF